MPVSDLKSYSGYGQMSELFRAFAGVDPKSSIPVSYVDGNSAPAMTGSEGGTQFPQSEVTTVDRDYFVKASAKGKTVADTRKIVVGRQWSDSAGIVDNQIRLLNAMFDAAKDVFKNQVSL